MKQYRLIEEYPGSPELGYIIKYTGNIWDDCNTAGLNTNPKDYPKFWEEIIEKDYEILKQEYIPGNCREYNNSKNQYKIISIKRLSDGEVFTINDKIKTFDCGYKPISSIRIEDNICRIGVREYGLIPLKNCEKQKQPLFTTKDGVDIYVGMSCYNVHKNTWTLGSLIQHNNKDYKYFEPSAANWWFSTKEKAEEYILLNKPCLSLKDVEELLKETQHIKIRNLVKSRL